MPGLGKAAPPGQRPEGEIGPWRLNRNMSDKGATDGAIARLATNQHGVVSVDQLRAIGLDLDAISYRVQLGRLHRLHRGVYAVGHTRLTDEGRWKAAVLACGPGAALSHRAAAALVGDPPPASWPGRRHRPGPRRAQATEGHPPASVLLPSPSPHHAAGQHPGDDSGANARGPTPLRDAGRAARRPLPGRAAGYRLDEQSADPDLTRSELERRFLYLCRRHGLPKPEVNVRIGEFEVDFLWRDRSLVVETDGYRYHRGRAAFEHDYRRQARLIAAGFDVIRFTWSQVVNDPAEALATRFDRFPTQPESRRAAR